MAEAEPDALDEQAYEDEDEPIPNLRHAYAGYRTNAAPVEYAGDDESGLLAEVFEPLGRIDSKAAGGCRPKHEAAILARIHEFADVRDGNGLTACHACAIQGRGWLPSRVPDRDW